MDQTLYESEDYRFLRRRIIDFTFITFFVMQNYGCILEIVENIGDVNWLTLDGREDLVMYLDAVVTA